MLYNKQTLTTRCWTKNWIVWLKHQLQNPRNRTNLSSFMPRLPHPSNNPNWYFEVNKGKVISQNLVKKKQKKKSSTFNPPSLPRIVDRAAVPMNWETRFTKPSWNLWVTSFMNQNRTIVSRCDSRKKEKFKMRKIANSSDSISKMYVQIGDRQETVPPHQYAECKSSVQQMRIWANQVWYPE